MTKYEKTMIGLVVVGFSVTTFLLINLETRLANLKEVSFTTYKMVLYDLNRNTVYPED